MPAGTETPWSASWRCGGAHDPRTHPARAHPRHRCAPVDRDPRRREAPVWPAATVTLIALLAVILRLAAAMALSVAQLFDEQGASEIETSACCRPSRSGSLKRSDCRRPSLAALGPARVTPSIPAPTPELVPHQRSISECTSRGTTMSVEQDRFRPEIMRSISTLDQLAGRLGHLSSSTACQRRDSRDRVRPPRPGARPASVPQRVRGSRRQARCASDSGGGLGASDNQVLRCLLVAHGT